MIRLIVIAFVIALMRCERFPESKDHEDRIASEKTDYDELKAEIYQIKLQMLEYHDKCPVKYGDSCFFGIFVNPDEVNQNAANLLCKKKGAFPGNIYSSVHYDELIKYIKPWIDTRLDGATVVGIRTGMTFRPQSQIVFFDDGETQADYKPWLDSQPVISSSLTAIVLRVYSDKDGIVTSDPIHGSFGVLCQIRI